MSPPKRLIPHRSLWQVLGTYVVGSWIALEVADTLDSTIGLPEWFAGGSRMNRHATWPSMFAR